MMMYLYDDDVYYDDDDDADDVDGFYGDEQVRAEEATLDASVPEANLTFQHLSRASQLPFKEKVDWFNKQCDLLRVPWDVEHQHLKV